MNIDQQIYKALLDSAGGNQSKIKGISKPTLIGMKNGTLKTTFSKLFTVLSENGITEIQLKSKQTSIVVNSFSKHVDVVTLKK